MRKHTEIILKKQFEIAGHLDKFDSIDFKNDSWFNDLTWTQEQEDKFKDWVIDYIMNNKYAGKEVISVRTYSKKVLNKWFSWWNLSYGFTIDYNE